MSPAFLRSSRKFNIDRFVCTNRRVASVIQPFCFMASAKIKSTRIEALPEGSFGTWCTISPKPPAVVFCVLSALLHTAFMATRRKSCTAVLSCGLYRRLKSFYLYEQVLNKYYVEFRMNVLFVNWCILSSPPPFAIDPAPVSTRCACLEVFPRHSMTVVRNRKRRRRIQVRIRLNSFLLYIYTCRYYTPYRTLDFFLNTKALPQNRASWLQQLLVFLHRHRGPRNFRHVVSYAREWASASPSPGTYKIIIPDINSWLVIHLCGKRDHGFCWSTRSFRRTSIPLRAVHLHLAPRDEAIMVVTAADPFPYFIQQMASINSP